MYTTSIKKKIRWMKRKSNNIEKYFSRIKIEHLDFTRDFHIKLHIDPWYRLYNLWWNEYWYRNPPLNVQKKMLNELINLYLKILSNQKINQYFSIWIFEKEFMNSQLVYSIDNTQYYSWLFSQANINIQYTPRFLSLIRDIKKTGLNEQFFVYKNWDYIENVVVLSK